MMRLPLILATAAMALGTLGLPVIASAHTRVVTSTPADGAAVAAPRVLRLTFSEALLPPTTVATIVMTAMPGMENHLMPIRNFLSAWSNGNKTLTLTLRQPLRTGTYEVRWQGAGADGHRMTGTVDFTVN